MVDNPCPSYPMYAQGLSHVNPSTPSSDHHNNNFLAEVTTLTTNTTTVTTSLPSLSNVLSDNGNVIHIGAHPPRPSPANMSQEAAWMSHGTSLTKSATQPSLCPAVSSQSDEVFGWLSGPSVGSNLAMSGLAGDSTDDLHGEVSEYTDAKSSLSAPVELLSEFLSAVMSKDYENALKLCQSILKYEPQNATAREFYPLISLKIKQMSDNGCHSSTDEGHESDEDTMDSYSSLEDEIDDDDQDLASSQPPGKPFILQPAPRRTTRTTEDTIIRISTPVQSSPESAAMSGSNSLDLSFGIDSTDSLFSSTESDLTLESVVNATRNINLGDVS